MKTIEITEEAYELLCERMHAGAKSFSDLIIAMDESCQLWMRKYMDLKEGNINDRGEVW